MDTTQLIIKDVAEAVEVMALMESQIKSLRALYYQCTHDEFHLDEDAKMAMLNAIERNGLHLASVKAHMANAIAIRSFPFTTF